MADIIREEWLIYADATAFLGNSLLGIVRQTALTGLRPSFWAKFPSFSDGELHACNEAMNDYVASLRGKSTDTVDAVVDEYDRLFTGEDGSAPAVALWEGAYRAGGEANAAVTASDAAVAMEQILQEAGLELRYQNNQHPDDMGVELLYLSVQCERAGKPGAPDVPPVDPDQIATFVAEHPLAWVADLRAAVAATEPGGYFDHLLAVVEGVLRALHNALSA